MNPVVVVGSVNVDLSARAGGAEVLALMENPL